MHTILSALCLIAFGCLWDSDTLRDEASLRPDAWEVITGQYPRHGEAYYRLRIAQLGLVAVPDRQQRIDLAAAQIRLKDFAAAERVLASLIAEAPDVYEAITDLAVLRRNQGRPAEAVPLFERALALHPAGHLGLGDWTLRGALAGAGTCRSVTCGTREFPGRTPSGHGSGRVDGGGTMGPASPGDSGSLAKASASTPQLSQLR